MTRPGDLEELRQRNRDLEAQLTERSAELARSERRYRRIFERSKDVIIVSTSDGRLIDINPAGLELYGYDSVEEMLPLDLRQTMWANPSDRDEYVAQLREFGFVQHFEADHLRRDGTVITVVGTTSIVTDRQGEMLELLTILRDISEQKRMQRELERLARSDSLTGLANRFVFRERLEAAVDAARHDGGRGGGFALLMLDLDNLKQINDTHGHPAGDATLIEVAQRFARIVGDNDVLARYGGDEFALLAFGDGDEGRFDELAERLVRSLDAPIEWSAAEIETSVSVGLAIATGDHRSADHLLQRADRALYRAKERGRDQYSR